MATMTDAIRAKVLVKASGLKSLPSGPIMAKTGKKLTTVVATAVRTALPTSLDARKINSRRFSSGPASSRCFRIFSQITMPISTMVPMAMAIPERATMLASTPKSFMAMKHISTASGKSPEMRMELRRCATIKSTTMMVTRISSNNAAFNVPRVSWMSCVRS